MAYAALTSLAGVIDQILPQDQRRYIYFCSKKEMEILRAKVSSLQEFLEDISVRPPLPAIDDLESRIRDITHKLEDTIELVLLSEPPRKSLCCVQFLLFLLKFDTTPDVHFAYSEVVNVLLEEATEMRKLLDNNVMSLAVHPLTSSSEVTGSKGTKVGLDKALKQIMDQVTSQNSKLLIVPITGMGGIGKTTLARASYEAPEMLRYFDLRFWVTVSKDYNVRDILRRLLPEGEKDDERLIEYVHKHLKSRRYLIILDDMWDQKVWDRVRNALPDDKNGSRIIITTRSLTVASYVGSSSSIHEMQFLNTDQSWELLRENVYGHDENRSTEFEGIGRMIAQNCKGLPLAVVVVAGLLKFNKTRDYWEQVARNTDLKAATKNDQLFEILSWSYTRLPAPLKACFLYMGAYKEDYEIPTKELFRLWAAEGFLKPKQSRSTEEVAEECLEELVERSLVLVTKRRYNGKVKTCGVHDVVRAVSIRIAEEEKFLYTYFKSFTLDESNFRNILANRRRVSFNTDFIIDRRVRGTYFTTHSFLHEKFIYHFGFIYFIQCFKLLRVLSTVHLHHSELGTLCTLTNLRFLHLVCDSIMDEHLPEISVPESISELQNLETLIVGASAPISLVFPLDIWKLQRLRHIVATRESRLQLPVPDERLALSKSNLQTLQTLYWVMNINFTKSFAERFQNLKKLKLNYSGEFLNSGHEFSMHNLQYLHQLQELSISRNRFYGSPRLINFVFPQVLKKLSLCGTNIPFRDLFPIGLLPYLKVLKLKRESISVDKWEPNEDEFKQLEYLTMENLTIRSWTAESTHFPRLRELVIFKCHQLEEVPESIGDIDTLEKLVVGVSGDEAQQIESVQRIIEYQRDSGNNLLQVIIES